MLFVLLKQTKMDSEQAEAALSELERLGPVDVGPAVSQRFCFQRVNFSTRIRLTDWRLKNDLQISTF